MFRVFCSDDLHNVVIEVQASSLAAAARLALGQLAGKCWHVDFVESMPRD